MTVFGPWLDYTITGLIIGNIYALLAVGLALIFGVANLINFAHRSATPWAPISAGGGGVLLGLTESYGVALFGSGSRNLFAFAALILVFAPDGLFQRRWGVPSEPMTGTFIARSHPLRVPRAAIAATVAAAALLPLLGWPYVLQTLTSGLLAALLALSLTLVAGTVGQISLGHAALLAIGGYASGLLALDWGWPVAPSVLAAGVITAALGTLLVYPALRMRGHYVSIATLGIGQIVALAILNRTGRVPAPCASTART
jgi:branched-chain amino acid transport system permease protein